MLLNTKHFGPLEVDADKLINFNDGLPGFEHLRDFALVAEPDADSDSSNIFYWLQSVENSDTAFVLVNMFKVNPDYNPLVPEVQMESLGEYNEEDFQVYNIAIIPDDIKNMTVNLKAPVIINSASKKGKQVICNNEEYEVKHYLFK